MDKSVTLGADLAGLDALLSTDSNPLFWVPERTGVESAWWGHIPFAFWITTVCKPRLLVELGTHNGVSYAGFCEAVLRAGLNSRCYAVDTWKGDDHAGHYDDDVYSNLRDFHDMRYASFSELIRSTFDDALHYFEDRSIDLLHIDGCHTYEAIRHDFEMWRPKLSDRAVVLLHDTNVRRGTFGVYRFFEEIARDFPSFEFLHGYGLGVLAVGADAPAAVRHLCSLTNEQDIVAIRERFSYLGARWCITAQESISVAAPQRFLAEEKVKRASPIVKQDIASADVPNHDQADRARVTPLVVLGMHCSGTSSLAGALVQLGGTAPLNLMAPGRNNERGHWESNVIAGLNDDILASGGSSWDDWRRFSPGWYDSPTMSDFRARAIASLAGEFGDAVLPIVKDPRMCRLMPFWSSVFREMDWSARFLLPVRSPLEVAWSLQRRDGSSVSSGCLLWLRHVLDAEATSRDRPRAIIDWNNFLDDWRLALARVREQMGVAWPNWSDSSSAEVDKFLSADLRHHRATTEDLRLHPSVNEWVRETYVAMTELAADPTSHSARSTLDEVRARFDEASEIFGSVLQDHEDLARRARMELQDQAEVARRARIDMQQHIEQLVAESAHLADRTHKIIGRISLRYAAANCKRVDRRFFKLRKARSNDPASIVASRQPLESIRSSAFFDAEYYLEANPDVKADGTDPALHYLLHGGLEGRDPSPFFSTSDYLDRNSDVAATGVNALAHYETHGRGEGRKLFSQVVAARELAMRNTDTAIFRNVSILYISGEPNTPGNHYRVLRYIDAALANGLNASWMAADELPERMEEFHNCDLVVFWRVPWNKHVEAAISLMRSLSKKIVFDVDDLMTEPDLAQTKIIDGIRSQNLTEGGVRQHYARIRQTMLAADTCFTATQELAFHLRWAGKPTFVIPNGFDDATHDLSRRAIREWRATRTDDLIRIGYAAGSRTHQRDLGLALEAIARLLRENALCRLVLFCAKGKLPLIDIEEFPALAGLEDRIEWRPLCPILDLPLEMARFDINLAPLEFGNPFCEAKSELKFFEAALAEVVTVASPTGPYRRAIEHGKTGFLAATADDWYVYLKRLVDDPALRAHIGRQAYYVALAQFGPVQRASQYGRVIEQLRGGVAAARAFALDAHLSILKSSRPQIYGSDRTFEKESGDSAEVTVIIPLYNYENYVVETLESVRKQTLALLDLVIVDDCSTDNSLKVAADWVEANAGRFNRVLVLKNKVNYGLGPCRNSGFEAADTAYVLPLDADNRILPDCCARLLSAAHRTSAVYVYPLIQQFGLSTEIMGNAPYEPQRFVGGNYIDAMALVSKEAWAIGGGYNHVRHGWEDYDLWCRLAELGLYGEQCPEILAEYRVHDASMLKAQTLQADNFKRVQANFERLHPWVHPLHQEQARRMPKAELHLTKPAVRSRIDQLLPILRCPISKQKLAYDAARSALISVDGLQNWPIVMGRPVLAQTLLNPEIKSASHISNELPDNALEIIRNTKGFVLNLSAGGSKEKFDHVVEVEYAVFRHTDIIADAHDLPFDDETFEVAIVMNAFEHYRDPHRVSAELSRVLKPGGRILVRTAFLQPLHERPWHFFNCTSHGMAEWFKNFQIEKLHVSDNFCPNHSIAWLASEAEAALRSEISAQSADTFAAAPIGSLIEIWRDPSKRNSQLWTDFFKLSQEAQEITAAGFEFLGSKPHKLPNLES